MVRRLISSLCVIAVFFGTASAARADTLCVKDKTRASVRSGRVTIRLPSQFSSTSSSCPTGYTSIFSEQESLSGNLSSGETLTGFWNLSGPGGTISYAAGTISFQKPLASAPTVEIVRSGGSGTNCTGSANSPTAPAGYLCIYEGVGVNIVPGTNGYLTYDATGSGAQSSRYGAALYGYPDATSSFYAWGTWAVTAP
jgi:hypothetical protein